MNLPKNIYSPHFSYDASPEIPRKIKKEEKNIEKLDKQSLLLIAVEMDTPSLLNLCKSSKRINEAICQKPQVWIDKLKRDYDFTFLGVPTKERDPRKYYQIFYNPPIHESYPGVSYYGPLPKNFKYNPNSVYEAIKFGYLDLVSFLFEIFQRNLPCLLLYIAVENDRREIFTYLFTHKKYFSGKRNNCLNELIKICIEKNYIEMLSLILNHYSIRHLEKFKTIENIIIDEKLINLAIEKKNVKILSLLSPYIKSKRKYFDKILDANDIDILKIFYDKEEDYGREVARSIWKDNLEFFKYLTSIDTIDDFDRYNKLDEIRKYVKLPEKELKIIENYMATIILNYKKAINILNYLFSIDGVYEYVLKHYAKNYGLDKEALEKYLPKKLTKEKSGYFSRFLHGEGLME